MRIDRASISNFRGFRQVDLEFHPKLNLIVGINGTGKTSVLEALRILIGSLFIKVDKVKDKISSPAIDKDDVRLENLERQYPVSLTAEGVLPELMAGESCHWTRTLATNEGRTTYREAKQIVDASEKMQKAIRDTERATTIPLLAYFSTERFKKEKKDIGFEAAGSRLKGYYNALDSQTNVKFFLDLWNTETIWEYQNQQVSTMLEAAKEAIRTCLRDCEDVRFDVKFQELLFAYRDGTRMPFHMLSDGVRSMFAMVMELAFRSYLLNPHLRETAPRETPGVVLIDEIDLHLHPEWQMRVLTDLQNAFPKIQFIVSTHAPLVVGSVKDGNIICIENDEISSLGLQYGRDANYILKEMGVEEMNQELKNKLEILLSLIQAGEGTGDHALQLRSELEEQLGSNHPELERADFLTSLFA